MHSEAARPTGRHRVNPASTGRLTAPFADALLSLRTSIEVVAPARKPLSLHHRHDLLLSINHRGEPVAVAPVDFVRVQHCPTHASTGVQAMKVWSFAFATFLTVTSAIASTAGARDQCVGSACTGDLKMSTSFEIARQYVNGGQFGGITPGTTGTALEIAQDSVDFFGAPDLYTSPWRAPPIVAKGK